MASPYKPWIGIDLGTTFSCVGLWKENGEVEILSNELGKNTTASVVSFEANEYVTVGEEAYERVKNNDAAIAYDVKRLIGRGVEDPQLRNLKQGWPFALDKDGQDRI